MPEANRQLKGCSPTQRDPDASFRRRKPHRTHCYSWVCTDPQQLEASERLMLKGLPYFQAQIAGLNTISTDDIRMFDDDTAPKLAPEEENATHVDELPTITSTTTLSTIPSLPLRTTASTATDAEKNIVLLVHGFAGGVAGWAQNWRCLSQRCRLYAIDLPGFARSERRPCAAKSLEEAMDYFCGYLRRWFERLGFQKRVRIVAHSFGCFVASHFAIRTGVQYVEHILLAEPWGLMRSDPKRVKRFPLFVRAFLVLFHGVGPFTFLRGTGPMGPGLLRRIRPDFGDRWRGFLEDPNVFYDYLYHCNVQPLQVGEAVFKACCHYDICAKESLVDSLPRSLDRGIGVGLLFGGDSWLNTPEGAELSSSLQARGMRVSLQTLADTGHQIFTDDVEGFNEKVLQMLEELSSNAPEVVTA